MSKRRTLIVTEGDVWALQQVIRDNTYYIAPAADSERRPDSPDPKGRAFREKINDLIVRFADETEDGKKKDVPEPTFELDVTDEELWLIDRNLPMSAYKGAQALLTQCFRIQQEDRLGFRILTKEETALVKPPNKDTVLPRS